MGPLVSFLRLAMIVLIFKALNANADCLPTASRQEFSVPVVTIGPAYLIGNDIHSIGAMAYSRKLKSWKEVVIQVDERNRNGDLVLSEGLPFTKATDNGILDQNDEVISRSEDWGDNFDELEIPKHVASRFSSSWKVHHCVGRVYAGTIIIGVLKVPRHLPSTVAVHFSPAEQFVASDVYRYQFNRKRAALLGQVFIRSGDVETAVFESSNFKMPLVTPWFVPDLHLSDDSFVSEIESWQVGPIRTVIAVGVKFKNFLSIFDFHMFSELVFYRSSFQIPTKIEFKFSPNAYLKSGSGIAYAVKLMDPQLWTISTNLDDLPLSPSAAHRSTPRQQSTVYTAEGHRAELSFAMRIMVDPKAASQTAPPYFISAETMRNQSKLAAWQGFSGLVGDLGVFIDFSGVSAGLYDFGLDLILDTKSGHEASRSFEKQSLTWTPLSSYQ